MLQNNHYPRLTVVIKLHFCRHHVIPMTRLLICFLQMAVFHLRTDALVIQYFTTFTLYHIWQTVNLFSDLIILNRYGLEMHTHIERLRYC